jgi:hypothetical protein
MSVSTLEKRDKSSADVTAFSKQPGNTIPNNDKFDFCNDPCGFKRFEFDELAISTISTMMGFTMTDIFNEEKNGNPDKAKIDKLEKALIVMSRERQEIYSGNMEIKRSVIERYCPILRKRMTNER